MSVPRIVDVVFGPEKVYRRPSRIALALAVGVGLHAGTVLWAVLSAPSLETWSAELATKVHAELTREVVIELPKPPPPPDKPPPPPPPDRAPERRAARSTPAPSPARAAKIVDAAPDRAVDLPETTFVTGSAETYAGGVTSSTGKSQVAVNGPIAAEGPKAGRRADRSAPVSIEESNWSCPWPREADAAEIDEQAVLIQVVVRADGTAESARTLADPGHGFGAAARACALATRFVPAHDADGKPLRAQSPPIRVHFFR